MKPVLLPSLSAAALVLLGIAAALANPAPRPAPPALLVADDRALAECLMNCEDEAQLCRAQALTLAMLDYCNEQHDSCTLACHNIGN